MGHSKKHRLGWECQGYTPLMNLLIRDSYDSYDTGILIKGIAGTHDNFMIYSFKSNDVSLDPKEVGRNGDSCHFDSSLLGSIIRRTESIGGRWRR